MKLEVEPYIPQAERHWPASGRAILAQFDERSVVVYQAYRSSIGHFAVTNQYFGGEFSLSRMSWVKPNFMWMMYRSSWGQAEGQEVVLAVRVHRHAFDEILRGAVHSTFASSRYPDQTAWEHAVRMSDVRLQWDPDHGPSGQKLERRAIQLGLRRATLASYSREWIIDIEDVSDFVAEQRRHVLSRQLDRLHTPRERVYPVSEASTADLLLLDHGRNMSAAEHRYVLPVRERSSLMVLTEQEARVLLSRLCVQLGFCLAPADAERICTHPPDDVLAFTEAVFLAEGLDPATADRHLYRQVRDVVAAAYAQAAIRAEREGT